RKGTKDDPTDWPEGRLQSATQTLTAIVLANRSLLRGNAFSLANRATCQKELDELAEVADRLADVVSNFHEPTILALADLHWRRGGQVRPGLLATGEFPKPGVMRHTIIQIAKEIANHARE